MFSFVPLNRKEHKEISIPGKEKIFVAFVALWDAYYLPSSPKEDVLLTILVLSKVALSRKEHKEISILLKIKKFFVVSWMSIRFHQV